VVIDLQEQLTAAETAVTELEAQLTSALQDVSKSTAAETAATQLHAVADIAVTELQAQVKAGAYIRPHFGSTSAHFMGYVGSMISPGSIRQGDTRRCDENGLG
jgi:flagellar capping protein FliD